MRIAASAPVFRFDELDSTNDEAQRRVDAGARQPCWIVADAQNAGRGRRGRAWDSLAGNLLVTYLGFSARPQAETALLGFAAALAIAEVAETAGVGAVRLKWPNDVLVDGRKCAGVLIEAALAEPGLHWAALGIGLNLATAPQGAAALGLPLAAAFDLLRGRLEFWSKALDEQGFAPLRSAWLARAHGLGAPVRATLGDRVIEGAFKDLNAGGELRLALPDGGEVLISAGEVFFPDLA